MKNKVLVFGTYDLLHSGHEHHLKKAAKLGELHVVVARDKTVLEMKNRKPIHDEKKRVIQLNKLEFVHVAYLGSKKDKYKIIEKIKPNIICLGYDQIHFTKNLKEELKKRKILAKIIRFRKAYRPDIYKSSKLRTKIETKK
ncbi:MAG: adenylyltransferase/cytidyltransferase family protein [Candidatus Nanoarchaeia archaeon]